MKNTNPFSTTALRFDEQSIVSSSLVESEVYQIYYYENIYFDVFCRMQNLALMIIDECHHAVKVGISLKMIFDFGYKIRLHFILDIFAEPQLQSDHEGVS